MTRARWMTLGVFCTLMTTAPLAWAGPDFSRTSIAVSPEAPREGELVDFTVVVRNSGTSEAGVVQLMAEWPLMGFLTGTAGLEGADVDPDARRLTTSFPLAVGGERRVVVRVLAPRDSGGDTLTLALRLQHFDSQTEYWDRRSVTIDTRVNPALVVGGFGITRAGIATLAVLAGGLLLWSVLRAIAASRRRPATSRFFGPGAAAAAITIAVGFWTLFGAMAWRDYQSLTSWREAACTVLGGRLSAQGTSTRRGTTSQAADDTNYVPVLGLKYAVDGQETYSSGFETGSRLGVGGRGGRLDELSRYAVGATVPCWYDPADPTDVVVLRGFGGAYVFALFPVPVFLFGVALIRRTLTSS